jgi:hypothetical protein
MNLDSLDALIAITVLLIIVSTVGAVDYCSKATTAIATFNYTPCGIPANYSKWFFKGVPVYEGKLGCPAFAVTRFAGAWELNETQPIIFLNANLGGLEKAMTLEHEYCHIKQFREGRINLKTLDNEIECYLSEYNPLNYVGG